MFPAKWLLQKTVMPSSMQSTSLYDAFILKPRLASCNSQIVSAAMERMLIRRPTQGAFSHTFMQGGSYRVCTLGSRALNCSAHFQRGGPQDCVQLPAGVYDGVHLFRTLLWYPALRRQGCEPPIQRAQMRFCRSHAAEGARGGRQSPCQCPVP